MFNIKPCIPDCQSLAAPILRPFHRPNLRVSWHLDLECARVCPSLLALCHLDHRCSRVHPNRPVSLPPDPVFVNLQIHKLTIILILFLCTKPPKPESHTS